MFLIHFKIIYYFICTMKNQITLGVKTTRLLSGYHSPLFYEIGPNTALIFDGHKTIHLLNLLTNSINKKVNLGQYNCKFISLTHSNYYQSIFILSDDWSITVFDLQMNYLTNINIGFKHVLQFHFIDSSKTFLLMQPNILNAIQVEINSNQSKTKFVSSLNYTIKQISNHRLKSLQYIKSIKFEQNTYIVINNLTDITVYYLYNLTIAIQLKDLTPKDNPIQCLIVCPKKLYLILGLSHGNIKIFKLSNQKYCLHELESHSKKILDFQINKSQQFLFSASEDETIRVFSLQSMQIHLSFKINQRYHIFKFFTQKSFLACQQDTIILGNINTKHELFHRHNSKIQKIHISDKRTILILTDNSIISLHNSYKISTSFTPPSSKQILQIQLNPYSGGNQYWMLTDTKQVYVYNIDEQRINKNFQIKQIHTLGNFINILKQQCTFQVTIFKFINMVPIRYDSEIKQNLYIQNKKSVYQFKPLVLGCNKGQLLIVSLNDMEQIECKLNFYKSQLIELNQIKTNNDDLLLIAITKSLEFYMISFNGKTIPNIIITYYLPQAFLRNYLYNDYLFITFKSGPFQIFDLKNTTPVCRTLISNNQHEQEITFLSFNRQNQYIATSSKDGKIKIWNIKKELLFEIIGDFIIQFAIISNDKILYSTQGTILIIKSTKYSKFLSTKEFQIKQYPERTLLQILQQYQSSPKKSILPKIVKKTKQVISETSDSQFKSIKQIKQFGLVNGRQKSNSTKKYQSYGNSNRSSVLQGYDYLFHFPNENILNQITGKSKL